MANLMLAEWFEMFNPLALMAISSGQLVGTKAKDLAPVAEAFSANCNRVFFAQRFPTLLFNAGRLFQVAESLAASELEGDPFKYASEHRTNPSKEVGDLRDAYMHKQKQPAFVPAALTQYADLLAAADRHAVAQDIELLMSMQLLSAWTTFETLLGDLLKVVISRPRLDAKGKTILAKKFYPARFLHDQGICQTYALTFHAADGIEINKIVTDDSFLAMFAVRNLIAHKAGKCDSKYLEYANKLPRIPQLKEGDQLELDGSFMCAIIPPALECCIRLIHCVDHWLISHP